MNALDIIEAVNALDESLLAEALTEEMPEKSEGMKSEAADCPAEKTDRTKNSGRRSVSGKRLRWGVAAACLLLTALTGATLSKSRAAEDPEAKAHFLEEFMELSERQSHAVGAYNNIVRSFAYDPETGMWIYPDDFADAYIDEDGETLVLCLKDPDEASIKKYSDLLGEGMRWVRIRPVKYSRNELQAIADELAKLLREQNVPVYMYGVDVMLNGIEFGTGHESVETIKKLFREKYPEIPAKVTGYDNPPTFTMH